MYGYICYVNMDIHTGNEWLMAVSQIVAVSLEHFRLTLILAAVRLEQRSLLLANLGLCPAVKFLILLHV